MKSGWRKSPGNCRHRVSRYSEIDRVLAKHYNLTDEEPDFIINYDIKYRLGTDEADED